MARSTRPADESAAAEARLLARLTAFLDADKVLSASIAWTDTNGDLRFSATLDIDGVTEEGLLLFGRASAALVDREVILGLRWTNMPGRFDHFDRFNWRPVSAHNNKGLGPAALLFKVFEGSHRHPLRTNAELPIGLVQAMADNLPVALPIIPEPPTWEAFLEVAAQEWRIRNLVTLPIPPWQYGLFPLTGDERRGRRGRGQGR